MKALVIYDSQFGNTAQIAQAIGQGLGAALGNPDDVQVCRIASVRPDNLAGLDLLIVGSPTQKFRPTPTTKNWLKSLPKHALRGMRVAAFDTRITEAEINAHGVLAKFVDIFGYAAQPIAEGLLEKGGQEAAPPEGFYVGGTEGPLLEGELERAAEWARRITAEAEVNKRGVVVGETFTVSH